MTSSQALASKFLSRSGLYLLVWALQSLGIFAATPILTRILEPDQYGRSALVVTLFQLFLSVLSLALTSGLQRLFVEADGSRRAKAVLSTSLAFTFAGTGTLAVPAYLFPGVLSFPHARVLACLTVIYGGLGAASVNCIAILRSEDRLAAFAAVSVAQSLGCQVVGIAAVLVLSRTAESYVSGLAVAQAVALVLGIASAINSRPRARRAPCNDLRFVLSISVPLVPAVLSALVLNVGDRLVIERILGDADVGRYQVVYVFGSLGIVVLSTVSQAVAPMLYGVDDVSARWLILQRIRDSIQSFAGVFVFEICLAAPVILKISLPGKYDRSSLLLVMWIVAISSLPYALYLSNLRVLIWFRATRQLAAATLVAAILNVGLNLALVPWIGLPGSATATFVSYVSLAVISSRLSRRYVHLTAPRISSSALVFVLVAASLLAVSLPSGVVWEFGSMGLCMVAAIIGTAVLLKRRSTERRTSGAHRTGR